MSRPVGSVNHYNPRPSTQRRLILDGALEYIEELEAADALPVGIRGIYYRLTGIGYGGLRKDQGKKRTLYQAISDVLVMARRAGLIPWDSISNIKTTWDHALQMDSRTDAEQFLIDVVDQQMTFRHVRQPRETFVVCEAEGLLGLTSRVAKDEYGLTTIATGGYTSPKLFESWARSGKPITILHCGDFDPSGVDQFVRLCADLSAFCRERDAPEPKFVRVALRDLDQIAELSIDTKSVNRLDKRSSWPGGNIGAELEALDPRPYRGLLRAAIENALDMSVFRKALKNETRIKKTLRQQLLEGGEQ